MTELKNLLKHLNDHAITFSLCFDVKTRTYILSAYDYIAHGKPEREIPVPLWTNIFSIDGELISHSVNYYSTAF